MARNEGTNKKKINNFKKPELEKFPPFTLIGLCNSHTWLNIDPLCCCTTDLVLHSCCFYYLIAVTVAFCCPSQNLKADCYCSKTLNSDLIIDQEYYDWRLQDCMWDENCRDYWLGLSCRIWDGMMIPWQHYLTLLCIEYVHNDRIRHAGTLMSLSVSRLSITFSFLSRKRAVVQASPTAAGASHAQQSGCFVCARRLAVLYLTLYWIWWEWRQGVCWA